MADSAALYGLVGALGGALLGAGAAITAPLLQHKDEKRTRRLARDTAELDRLIALRSTTRAALTLRSEAVRTMENGQPLNVEELLTALDSTWTDATRAADAAAADGLYFAMSPTTVDARWPQRQDGQPERKAGRRMDGLREIDREIRFVAQQYEQRETLEPDAIDYLNNQIEDLTRQIRELEQWRAELLGELLDRMDVLRDRARPD
ncbi:hypothetical protein [Streptomyces longisporus]